MKMDDVGKSLEPKVVMAIKAPRGTLVLFEPELHQYGGKGSFPGQAQQCKAIRYFMREHKND